MRHDGNHPVLPTLFQRVPDSRELFSSRESAPNGCGVYMQRRQCVSVTEYSNAGSFDNENKSTIVGEHVINAKKVSILDFGLGLTTRWTRTIENESHAVKLELD